MSNCAIVGINWGDEGKGRMVDLVTADYDVVVRYQGGGNAGHTVVNEFGKFALHLLPSGIFRKGVVNILGNGVALDCESLWTEMSDVMDQGVAITAVVRARGRRKRRAYSAVLGAVCAGLSVCAATCLLWGVCYYTDTFQDRSGIRAEEVSLPDLTAVTAWFAENLAQTADQVPRDEAGTFNASLNEIFAGSTDIYQGAEDLFPFLEFEDRAPKRMFFSRVMSAMNFTGVYFAFTGESNINVDAPACLIPSTIAHELSHQRGIASEQECNFLAVLASTTSGDPVYEYSGWLMGYIHLGNALYQADPAAWQAIRDSLPDTVLADLASNNAYWASFEGAAADASQKVYDTILKGYGQEDGIRSYGTVVDLLVAYYRDTARTNGSEGLTT